MKRHLGRLGMIWGVAAVLSGCGETPMDAQDAWEDGETSEAELALETSNMLSANALDMNALDMNALDMNALDMNALDMNALDMNALDMNGLLVKFNNAEPASAFSHATRGELVEELFRYIYGCAMPAGTTLQLPLVRDGQTKTVTFQGSLGLAPEWQTGACGLTCQRWVSACVLARVNAYHVPVKISLRGNHPALTTTQSEIDSYPIFEAKFYGNIFDSNDLASPYNVCQGTGASLTHLTSRACAQSGGYCSMNVTGSCTTQCNSTNGTCSTAIVGGSQVNIPAIEVWLANPAPGACGNGACEAGESSANCIYDCTPSASTVDHEPAGTSATTMVAAPLNGTNVVYAGITNSTSPLVGLSALDTGTKTARDLFMIKANAAGTYSGMKRIAMPNEDPIALDAYANSSGAGHVALASGSSATGTLTVFDASTLSSVWTKSLYTSTSGYRIQSVSVEPSAYVHVVGTVEALSGGVWTPQSREYRKYAIATGTLAASRSMSVAQSSPVSWAPGDGKIYFAQAVSTSSLEVRTNDAAGQTANDTVATVAVSGLTNIVPKAIREGVFVAGNGTTASGSKGAFIGRLYPGTSSWAWQTVISPDGNRAIEIHSMRVRGHAVVITGKFKGPLDFRGSTPAEVPSARAGVNANEDAFVAAYEVGTGALSWVRTYGGPGIDQPDAFTFDETNRLWFFGRFVGTPQIEGAFVPGSDGAVGVDSMRVLAGPLSLAQTSPILAGGYATVVVRNGQLYAWGFNGNGALGISGPDHITTPTLSLTSVIKAAAGTWNTLALRADGTVWITGDNYYGQRGTGTTNAVTPPSTWTQVPGLTGIVDIAAANFTLYAIQSNGQLWAWGENTYGAIGDGTTTHRYSPVVVPGLSNVVSVAACPSVSSVAALRADGTVYAWGENTWGAVDPSKTGTHIRSPRLVTGMSSIIAVRMGELATVALRRDGTVWTMGRNAEGALGDGTFTARTGVVKVVNLNDVIGISAGGIGFATALRKDGTIWSWGYNSFGHVGDGTTIDRATPVQVPNFSNVVQIAAGYEHMTTRTRNGDMGSYGGNAEGQLANGALASNYMSQPYTRAKNLADGTSVSASKTASAVVRNGTLLRTCGTGALGDSSVTMRPYFQTVFGLSDTKQAAFGEEHGLAVSNTGTVYAWGRNAFGQLGDGTMAERQTPKLISGLSGISKVVAGDWFSLAMTTSGTAYTFGDNSTLALGISGLSTSTTPRALSGLGTVRDIAAGANHGLLVNSTGILYAWGKDSNGQLGRGTATGTNQLPQAVVGLSGVTMTKVAAAESHSLALDSAGNVWAFGNNSYGQLGGGSTSTSVPTARKITGISSATAIATGERHSLVLRSNGTVWAVGDNSSGQLGDGTTTSRTSPVQVSGLSGIIAIAAGDSHSLALKSDGTVWAFGSRGKGQLCDGLTSGNALVPVQVTNL